MLHSRPFVWHATRLPLTTGRTRRYFRIPPIYVHVANVSGAFGYANIRCRGHDTRENLLSRQTPAQPYLRPGYGCARPFDRNLPPPVELGQSIERDRTSTALGAFMPPGAFGSSFLVPISSLSVDPPEPPCFALVLGERI